MNQIIKKMEDKILLLIKYKFTGFLKMEKCGLEMKNRIQQIKGKLDHLNSQKENFQDSIESLNKKVNNNKRAMNIIMLANQKTQVNFKNKVESLVSKALENIFETYKFILVSEIKRNQIEFQPHILDNNKKRSLKYGVGDGAIDIVGFALRVIMICFESPRKRRLIFLDEPFLHLGKMREMAYSFIQEVSKKLGFQIILLTHDENIRNLTENIIELKEK